MVKQEGKESMSVVRGAHCVVPFLVPLLTIKLNYYHMLNCCKKGNTTSDLMLKTHLKSIVVRKADSTIYYSTFSLPFFSMFLRTLHSLRLQEMVRLIL